jgi:uncharacterized protein
MPLIYAAPLELASLNWITQATGLPLASLALVALLTFAAATIRGLTGFGMAIILVPLLGMVIRPADGVILAILLQLMIGPVGIRNSLALCERPASFVIAGCAVLATPIGLWLLGRTSPDLARVMIAAIAIGAFLIVILPKKGLGEPGRAVMVATGLTAGVLTGFAAMPGPPVVPYFLRGPLSPHQARASMMVVFFATATAGTVSSVVMGLTTWHLPPMLFGNWIGSLAFGRIPPVVWRTCVALLLGVSGCSAIWRAIN